MIKSPNGGFLLFLQNNFQKIMKSFLLLFLSFFAFNNHNFNTYQKDIKLKTESKKTTQRLFVIERNMNKNTVCYDANLLQDGKLDTDNPIDAYWIDYATDGKRTELNYIQRRMAYGFTFEKTAAGNIYVTLKAFEKRKILLTTDSRGNSLALLKINGTDARLTKIFVTAKPKMYTNVEFIELFGIDIKSGKNLYEKIDNL